MNWTFNSTKCSIILAIACLACQASAQGNWWDKLLNRDPTTTTTTSTRITTQSPPVQGTTECPCTATPEYNPVCGDDGVTYWNMGRFNCARNCNGQLRVNFIGACEPVV